MPPKKSNLGRVSSKQAKYIRKKREDEAFLEADRERQQKRMEAEEHREQKNEGHRSYMKARRSVDKREQSRNRLSCLERNKKQEQLDDKVAKENRKIAGEIHRSYLEDPENAERG